jgi:beta-lactamase class A
MIKVSDNDCGRALRKIISADKKPLEDLAEAGFVGTNLMNDYPVTSVSDVVLLFDKLYNNTDLEADTNNLFLDSLALQEINNRLPLGLPETAQILHKTADLEGYSHDGGIIYATFGDFIVVIMSGPWPDGVYDSPPVFIEIMRTIYDELSSLSSS